MRLLTIQSNAARLALMRNGIYRPSWSWIGADPDWRALYRLMVAAMARRGLSTTGRPPVWAWPCDRWLGGPMTLGAALFFLGGPEQADGAWVIEFDAPARLCLLSSYRAWQDIVFSDAERRPDTLADLLGGGWHPAGTRVCADARAEPDDYQVCLPLVRRAWVRRVRPLLPPRVRSETWRI